MKNSVLLHICPDDKFYNAFIRNQKEYAPNTVNEYYVISEVRTSRSSPEDASVKTLSIAEMKKILKASNIQKYHQVLFHSFPGRFRKHFLPYIPKEIKITWIFYGYEYYHRRIVIEEYLGPKTRAYYNSWQNPNFAMLKMLRFLDQIRNEDIGYKNDLQRIHQFAHWNPKEYEIIKSHYELTKMEYVPFSMGLKVHELVPDHDHRYLLLGHSGALTVNHLDGIKALDHRFIESFDRVLIPFSYGANKTYEAKVRKAAEKKMGNKVIFLNQFMDRTSYFNLLSRVKVAWMPQLRGMGGGNILFCLKNNIALIFWKDSIMYQYYASRGFHVFAISEVGSSPIKLTPDQKQNNQNKLNKNFGEEIIKVQYQKLLHS